MNFKKLLILILGTFNISAAFALDGKIVNNHYSFRNNTFSMMIPPLMELEVKDKKTQTALHISFISGKYWMMDGEYLVDVYPIEGMASLIKAKAYKEIEKTLAHDLKAQTQPHCQYIKIPNAIMGYQCTVKFKSDNTDGIGVVTALAQKNFMVHVYAIEKSDSTHQFNWQRYNNVLHSIQTKSWKNWKES